MYAAWKLEPGRLRTQGSVWQRFTRRHADLAADVEIQLNGAAAIRKTGAARDTAGHAPPYVDGAQKAPDGVARSCAKGDDFWRWSAGTEWRVPRLFEPPRSIPIGARCVGSFATGSSPRWPCPPASSARCDRYEDRSDARRRARSPRARHGGGCRAASASARTSSSARPGIATPNAVMALIGAEAFGGLPPQVWGGRQRRSTRWLARPDPGDLLMSRSRPTRQTSRSSKSIWRSDKYGCSPRAAQRPRSEYLV